MSSREGSGAELRSYYGQPVLKEPEWTREVPWYLFAGGLAGVSSAIAHFARRSGCPRTAERMTLMAAAAGGVAGPALLISDLGRPKRFLNMLRVFKPTSAMNVGSWLLAFYGTAAAGTATLQVAAKLPRLRRLAGAVAGALGMPMATYTAVLLADSSIPVWHEARGQLPYVFAGSAAASAGGAAILLAPPEELTAPRRLAITGAAVELAAGRLMQRRMSARAGERGGVDVGDVYRQGPAGRYHRAGQMLTAAGAAFTALGGWTGRRPRTSGLTRSVALSRAGAGLMLVGSVCERWAVYHAGFQSARDPRYVVGPQRARLAHNDHRQGPDG